MKPQDDAKPDEGQSASTGVLDVVKPVQYLCEMCGYVFDSGWSDDEAKAEAEVKGLDIDDCGIVCDDCYKLTPWGMASND